MIKIKSPLEFNSLIKVAQYFKEEETCLLYIEQMRWDGNIKCPYCLKSKIYKYNDGIKFKCASCRKQFTAKTKSIFSETKIKLSKWMLAIYLLGNNKKGISTYQLSKHIEISQPAAWLLTHKIRKALGQDNEPIGGIVETDESFVGGKNKNRHKDKKVKNSQGRSFKDKTPVWGAIERGGKLITSVVPDTKAENIQPLIYKFVKEGSTIYSDEWWAYQGLNENYNHSIIDHRRKQYKNGDTCTNTIEGVWSHLKRTIVGTHHRISKKHLQSYMDEITFRYNTRSLSEGGRFLLIMSKINNTLTYKQLIHGKAQNQEKRA